MIKMMMTWVPHVDCVFFLRSFLGRVLDHGSNGLLINASIFKKTIDEISHKMGDVMEVK